MVAEAVLEAELHLVEHELRCVAQFVVPGDQCVAHDDLALPQQPIGQRGVVGAPIGIDGDACDANASGRVAAHRQLGVVDDELAKAEIEQRQRRPGNDQIDARQVEERLCRAVGAIAKAKTADGELGIPAVPTGRDRVDLDRLADLLR